VDVRRRHGLPEDRLGSGLRGAVPSGPPLGEAGVAPAQLGSGEAFPLGRPEGGTLGRHPRRHGLAGRRPHGATDRERGEQDQREGERRRGGQASGLRRHLAVFRSTHG